MVERGVVVGGGVMVGWVLVVGWCLVVHLGVAREWRQKLHWQGEVPSPPILAWLRTSFLSHILASIDYSETLHVT